MLDLFDSPEWKELQESQEKWEREFKERSEATWNSLSPEQQLEVFCAVSRRIYQGELIDNESYRGVLYDVFDFGDESYAAAQFSGYLELHNSIFTEKELSAFREDLEKLAEEYHIPKEAINKLALNHVRIL